MSFYSKEELDAIRMISVQQYFQFNKPEKLEQQRPGSDRYNVQLDGEDEWHKSLCIKDNGYWSFFSKAECGTGAIDWLIKIEGKTFPEACQILQAPALEILQTEDKKDPGKITAALAERYGELRPAKTDTVEPRKYFSAPSKDRKSTAHISYLENRGIDPKITTYLTSTGLIYTDSSDNSCVFAGYDSDNKMRSAGKRRMGVAPNPDAPIKWDVSGSDKRFSFAANKNPLRKSFHFFEGPVDALAYASYLKRNGAEWRLENLISVNGLALGKEETTSLPPAMLEALKEFKNGGAVIHLHFDNDEIGKSATERFRKILEGLGFVVYAEPSPKGKDWAEYNKMLVDQTEPNRSGEEPEHGERTKFNP